MKGNKNKSGKPGRKPAGAKCGAKKRDGSLCKKPPVKGRNRCRLHGGAQKRGAQHHSFKDGRYSKLLPARFLAEYERSRQDPDIMRLRDEVALVDVRIKELVGKLDTGETGEAWRKLQQLTGAYTEAKGEKNPEAQIEAAEKIVALIQAAGSVFSAWNEINMQVDVRRRLVETESRVMINLSSHLTLDNVGTYFAALTAAVKAEAPEDVIQRIQARFAALTSQFDNFGASS